MGRLILTKQRGKAQKVERKKLLKRTNFPPRRWKVEGLQATGQENGQPLELKVHEILNEMKK